MCIIREGFEWRESLAWESCIEWVMRAHGSRSVAWSITVVEWCHIHCYVFTCSYMSLYNCFLCSGTSTIGATHHCVYTIHLTEWRMALIVWLLLVPSQNNFSSILYWKVKLRCLHSPASCYFGYSIISLLLLLWQIPYFEWMIQAKESTSAIKDCGKW